MFFCSPVLADYTYQRVPAGTEISNPVTFSVTHEANDFGCDEEAGFNYWRLKYYRGVENFELSIWVASSTLSYDFVENLPVDFYWKVTFGCSADGVNENQEGTDVEAEAGFEVIENEQPPGFFNLPADFASSSLAYIGTLFTDLSVPIYILIGFSLFFWVGNWVIGKFRDTSKEKKTEHSGSYWLTEQKARQHLKSLEEKYNRSEAGKFFKSNGVYGKTGHPRRAWNKYSKKWS